MPPYRVRVPLRWVDLDAQGHANNASIVDYLQEARVDFLLNSPQAHLLGDGIIVVEHQVEYVGPVWFGGDDVAVDLWVGRVGAAQFRLGYQVFQGERLVARAQTVLANFDFAAHRPARFAPGEREWFALRASDLEPFSALGEYRVGEHHHRHPITVRWSDVDGYGHVNNVVFFDYVAEARIALKEPLLDNAITGRGAEVEHTWMVARQDLRYLGQMRHRLAPYEVRTAIGRLGRTSMTLAAEVVDPQNEAVLSRSTTVLVHGDAAGRPQPLPAPLRDLADRWAAVDLQGER